MGASTCRDFSEYWPGQDPSHPVNRLPKHVVSATLTSAPWGELDPATVHGNGLADALTAVRAGASGDVIVWGSLALVRGLFDLRAVDEPWLRTVPVLIGAGVGFAPRYRVDGV